MKAALFPELARIALYNAVVWLGCWRPLLTNSNGLSAMFSSARPLTASTAHRMANTWSVMSWTIWGMLAITFTAMVMFHAGTAQAQEAPASPPTWRLVCADENDASTCSMNQELFLQQTVDGQLQTVGRLLNLTIVYLNTDEERVPFMSLQMPLGVDLRPGAVMRVDEESETALEFLRCTEAGCDSSARVTPELLAQLRAGSMLRVGFRPWGSEQVTAVEASLIGFTAAFAELR